MKFKTKKIKMSQIFDKNGNVIPVTLLKPQKILKEEKLSNLVGQIVEIRGVSKGKGFTGVMKRWGFSGHPATHGHSSVQRKGGSIGVQGEGRVMPGKKMPGRSGGKKICIKGLKVLKVENGDFYVSGPVPGHKGGVVEISIN